MSIPSNFSNAEEYFERCLLFLQKYSWIYESSNTSFVRDKILEKFPTEWHEYFTTVNNEELNSFPLRKLKTKYSNIEDFIRTLDELIPKKEQLKFPLIDCKLIKMSPKKQHEILRLSALIESTCKNDIDILVDFGSGLGYLSEILNRTCDFKIIGLESDRTRVQTSIKRHEAIFTKTESKVLFEEHYVTNESEDFILSLVDKMAPELGNPKLAIAGLHACADLTINSIELFLAMKNVRKLIIMPCCYHKLEVETKGSSVSFKNFPLSNVLKKAKKAHETFNGFNRPFLRLACQQTSVHWKTQTEKEHIEHSLAMFLRGAVDAILNDDETVVKNKSKKIQQEISFEELCSTYELRSKVTNENLPWRTEHKHRFAQLLQKYPNGPKLAEGLTCLQASMQELCENIVLYDRICYIEEEAIEHRLQVSAKFEKIMDQLLSPRCYALIAQKL